MDEQETKMRHNRRARSAHKWRRFLDRKDEPKVDHFCVTGKLVDGLEGFGRRLCVDGRTRATLTKACGSETESSRGAENNGAPKLRATRLLAPRKGEEAGSGWAAGFVRVAMRGGGVCERACAGDKVN